MTVKLPQLKEKHNYLVVEAGEQAGGGGGDTRWTSS